MEMLIGLGILALFILTVIAKTEIVVPQRIEYVVERLGK